MLSLFYDTTIFTIVYTFLFAGSIVIGYWYAERKFIKKNRVWKPIGVENGVIGFFGLILSFVLVMAGTTSKERNALIHSHSNALEVIHMKSLFFPQNMRTLVDKELLYTIALREQLGNADAGKFDAVCGQIEKEYLRIWNELKSNAATLSPAELNSLTQHIAEATALHYQIKQSYLERTPMRLMLALLLGSWLIGLLIGFMAGVNTDHNWLVPIIFFVLTLVIVLTIHDLDNPQSGLLRPSYSGYENLKQMILNSTM